MSIDEVLDLTATLYCQVLIQKCNEKAMLSIFTRYPMLVLLIPTGMPSSVCFFSVVLAIPSARSLREEKMYCFHVTSIFSVALFASVCYRFQRVSVCAGTEPASKRSSGRDLHKRKWRIHYGKSNLCGVIPRQGCSRRF